GKSSLHLSHAAHEHLPPFPTRRSSDLRRWTRITVPLRTRQSESRLAVRVVSPDQRAGDELLARRFAVRTVSQPAAPEQQRPAPRDRKSTRLNSSHVKISYAVFCLKKKT